MALSVCLKIAGSISGVLIPNISDPDKTLAAGSQTVLVKVLNTGPRAVIPGSTKPGPIIFLYAPPNKSPAAGNAPPIAAPSKPASNFSFIPASALSRPLNSLKSALST